MAFKKELNRYLKNHGEELSSQVVEYSKVLINRIETNSTLYDFFTKNNINVYTFLIEAMPLSEKKFKVFGGEKLDETEINKIFGTVILKNELLRLQLQDDVIFSNVNQYNEIIYELSDDALKYFLTKYGVKMTREFSIRDITVISAGEIGRHGGEEDEEEDDDEDHLRFN